MSTVMTFTATGDSFITRRLPSLHAESFRQLSSLIQQAEVRFTNLEVTTHRYEGIPAAVSGGTWAVAPPEVLEDIRAYGFNLLSWANNHTLDYSIEGLRAMKRYLDHYGFVHAGAGDNLAEASQPKYLDCPSGRVALIAVTSTFHDSWVAGDQRPDMIGRPGINPLRYSTTYRLPSDQLEQLRNIAKGIGINAKHEQRVKEGYAVASDDGQVLFGDYRFAEGTMPGYTTKPLERDVQRIHKAIKEAERSADYVLVSLHAHEMAGDDKSAPAEFIKTFSRSCIDAGAHAVIGHGPHILRGIEIYKQRPIFYSLGNFIFQNETVTALPADFYEKYGLDHTHGVADAFDKRTNGDTKGLGVNKLAWETIVPFWSMEDGYVKEIRLYPVELGYGMSRYQRGWPKPSENINILEHLQQISAPFQTKIDMNGSVGIIRL